MEVPFVASRIYSRHCDKGNGLEKCSLGSIFGTMLAPGHASGGPMCPTGGLDPFWGCFGGQMVAQKLDFEGSGDAF